MSLKENYRNITGPETEILKSNGCNCDDWSLVRVTDGFNPARCKNVIFSGNINIGILNEPFVTESGVIIPGGIYNARLHNCTIGSDVVISNIGAYIANYNIEDKVVIINCGRIHTEGISSFGNGTSVAVLSEQGGRSVKIWDRLSSHQAYIVALYRYRSTAVKKIEKMVDNYTAANSSGKGIIGGGSQILDCSNIRNVKIGPFSRIEGAMTLNEGSVNSCKEDPVYIGSGVIMEHFVLCSGSKVTESTLINRCFIGQGCVLAKHYSAENSLFFANCEGFHGEACSIFAGPYTVTHHKSTLLIAGLFSFMNAGSGTNQSNHMYKLGPVHQGIMERGSKTTSNSYLLWPSHIGPFTIVKGHHSKNLDTSSFPFSYLIESNNESILIPGVNFRNIGTIRDAQKWKVRDRRKDSIIVDRLTLNLLNPYIVGKMVKGRNILKQLKSEYPDTSSLYTFNNVQINRASLDRGIELYQLGINKFLGNSLIKKLENTDCNNIEELRKILCPDWLHGKGEWLDLSGLVVPKQEIEALIDAVESESVSTVEELGKSFNKLHLAYKEWEWVWSCEMLEEESCITVNKLTVNDIVGLIELWKKSVLELDNLLYEDGWKEFNTSVMTGYGIDSGDDDKKLDFLHVRGEFAANSLVAEIQEHIVQKSVLADKLIERMKRVRQ
jgi:carbonic anhydrase/acetyltransferase-like protein (isoleucine patch superfamily)